MIASNKGMWNIDDVETEPLAKSRVCVICIMIILLIS